MPNVLLVGPWCPAALAFARSAARRGLGVYLLQATSQLPNPSAVSGLRGATAIPPHLVGTREGLDAIKRYAADVEASALVALLDNELLWLGEHRTEFGPSCRVLMQTTRSYSAVLSKCHQLNLAQQAGLVVLPTYLLLRPEDAAEIPAAAFPLVLRPDRAEDVQPPFKVRLVHSPGQLQDVIRGCLTLRSPIIAQPFQRLPNLLVHGVRRPSGDVIASRCYVVPRKFEGVTLALDPSAFPPGLDEKCREFAAIAGITGCYHLEFLFSPKDNRAYFLEVNARLGGTTDKVVQTGFDEPALLLQAYDVIPRTAPPVERRARRIANKRALLKHVVAAARGRLTALDYPVATPLAHIAYSCRDLLLARDSIFDWRDVMGSVKFHLRGLTS
jgi:hypothetical protein